MSNVLFVGNLAYDVTAPELGEMFHAKAPVVEVRIVAKDRIPQGYAFVTMRDEDAAERILEEQSRRPYFPKNGCWPSVKNQFTFHLIKEGEPFEVDGVLVNTKKMKHPGNSYAFSFEEDGNGGYTISPALTLTYLTNSGTGHEAIAQCIQQDWGLVGIDVKVETEEWNVFLEDRKAGNYDIARNGWIADFNDPINMLEMWLSGGGNNDTQLGTATGASAPKWDEYDALINQIYTETDFAKRVDLMRQAEDMLMETGAIVPIYYYNDIYDRWRKKSETRRNKLSPLWGVIFR